MGLFIKKCIIFCFAAFCFACLPFLIILYGFGISLKDLPATRISNSFTYNEKMAFLRNKQADILGIGSSCTLKNLDSKEVVDFFKSESYLNTASFGMTIYDSYMLLKLNSEIHKPKVVVMNTSITDFTNSPKLVNYTDLKSYLTTTGYNNIYFQYINICYDLTQIARKKDGINANSPHPENTLIYDKYGATPVNKANVDLSKDRYIFDKLLPQKKYDQSFEYNYKYLDSITSFCKNNKIALYIFQPPIRESIFKTLTPAMLERYTTHNNRLKYIIAKKAGIPYVDGFERLWNDSLFVDGVHMNWVGAKQFSKYCFDKLANGK